MKKFFILLLITLLSFGALDAAAVLRSFPIPSDSRIRNIVYKPDTVFAYTGYYGYQARIDLDPSEEIYTISLGDSSRWMLNPVGHRLFLKPIEFDATTNMTIITDKRIYYFELYAEEAQGINDPNLVWATRFVYNDVTGDAIDAGYMEFNYNDENNIDKALTPENSDIISPSTNTNDSIYTKGEVPDPVTNADILNLNYSIKGMPSISPIEVFDDGQFTYMKFSDSSNAPLPAIFIVMPDRQESLVNFRVKSGYIIVETVASQFSLRYGDRIVCVYNEEKPLEKPIFSEEDEESFKVFGLF